MNLWDNVSAIVAHDAGGAEILASIARRLPKTPILILSGPAESIFQDRLGATIVASLSSINSLSTDSDFILTGSSYPSDFELRAIASAKAQGVKCAAILDHWQHYWLRFRNQAENLPNEIWLADDYAYDIALAEGFPPEKLKKTTNPHLDDIVSAAKDAQGSENNDSAGALLFLCEPISLIEAEASKVYGFDEYTLVRELLENAGKFSGVFTEIIIRPHPKEPPEKYQHLLRDYQEQMPVRISKNTDVLDDMALARTVVAIESMGLVIASLLGKTAISWIPSCAYTCALPHREILRLNSIGCIGEHVN